jgi:hypothetical protein
MTQTFTSNLNETATKLEKENHYQLSDSDSFRNAGPSINVINNILNFSKNLEVKRSRFVNTIEVIKS